MNALVVDVGGTRIKWAALAPGGGLTGRGVDITPPGADAVLEAVLERLRSGGATVLGLALPGLVDGDDGVWRYSANLGARDFPVRQWFAARGIEVAVLANDVAAAAAGEARGGSLALLQLGTGVGARLVVDGLPLNGTGGMAGELGHLVIDPTGPQCGCGRRGCVEAFAGWRTIRPRLATLGVDTDPALLVDQRASGQVQELARSVFHALGVAAASLVAVLDPGEVRLGGGLAAAWGTSGAARIAAVLRLRVLAELAETPVTVSTLGEEAALLGLAELLVRQPGLPGMHASGRAGGV